MKPPIWHNGQKCGFHFGK